MEDLVALLFLLPSAEKVLLDDTQHLKKRLYPLPGIFLQRPLYPLPVKQLLSNSLMCSTKFLGPSLWEVLSMELTVLWLGPGMGLSLSSSSWRAHRHGTLQVSPLSSRATLPAECQSSFCSCICIWSIQGNHCFFFMSLLLCLHIFPGGITTGLSVHHAWHEKC